MDFEREWNVDAAADRQQAHDPVLDALAARVKGHHIQPGTMRTVAAGPDGVVVLPAGTDINQIEVDGRNLIVTLPDGTQMVILDGAVVMPHIVVGDVEIPSVNLAALLIGEEPQPAAGPARSSGGNFLAGDGAIGDPFALGDLLPPTELAFTQPEEREILPIAPDEDDTPEVLIVTPDQPTGATDATAGVSEAGLPARDGEPAGSAAAGDGEQTSGTIIFSADDGPSLVTINGVAVTAVDQSFETPIGTLIITSIENGQIGYRYALADNVVGPPPVEIFTVVVTDSDGDQATATLTISIADDAPSATNDADSVTEDDQVVADGNLFTGSGGADANTTDGVADVQGADGASVTTTGTFQGTYGVLTISAGGGYSYTLANDNPAVQFLTPGQTLAESFAYTITDADGDTSSATLTIIINGADDGVTITGVNGEPGAEGAELVVLENDLSDGSSPDAAALTRTGSFGVSGADGLTSVTVGGVTVLNNGAFVPGQVVTTPLGTLTITGFTATAQQGGTPTSGTFTYSFVLTDNSLNHDVAGADSLFQNFAIVATDRNGSTASGSIDVQIVDDLPTARADVDGVAAGTYGPEGGNVITGEGTVSGAAGADTKGADGAAVAGVAAGAVEGASVDVETVGQAVQGQYGTLTLNVDGSYSYVRAAGTPGGVSDSFTYTLRDGEGDLSVATLRIDIADSDVVIISIPRIGEGTVVDEAGLDAGVGAAPGSNAAANIETTAGAITYSAPDAPSTVTINGQLITQVGQTIDTDKGTLKITGISEGRIEYSYTLTDNTSGDDVTDSFVVTIADVDGDIATDTLVITILDDHPTAVADVDSVKEDGPLVADGNVLTGANVTDANNTDGVADVQGADGATVTDIAFDGATGTVGEPLPGTYGSLIILADGRYTYTLNNANGVVQGLDSTEQLTEEFSYTITDGDGDSRSATITITINGNDDGVTITNLSGEGAEQIVYEDDLADGSSPDASALTRTGSFDVTALDGVGTITVGGQTIFNGSFVPGVAISNAYGTLTIEGFTSTLGADGDVIGGTVDYSYVLNDNRQHLGGNDVSLIDSFAVVVRDTDNSEAAASLDVQVFDDAPTARDDAAAQASENVTVQINVVTGAGTLSGAGGADTLGADGVDLTVAGGKLVLTSGPSLGTAVYQGNGVFLYTANAGAEGQDSFTYTITDGDGDSSTATVTIQLAGDSVPTVTVGDLVVSEAGLPNGSAAAGNSETATGSMTITTGGDTLDKVEVQDKNGAWIDVTGATVGSPVVVQGDAGTLTVTSDGLGHYSYSYTLAVNDPTHPDFNPNDGDGINGAADAQPGDSFAVRATDSDGDVSTVTSIDVTVQDDAPTLDVAGPTSVVEGESVNGTWSQVVGADQPGVTQVVFNGTTYALGTPIDTGKGTLTVNANGTWTFAAVGNLDQNVAQSISFTVKVTDADDDVAQDEQTITIGDGAVPTAGPALNLLVDDQNLSDGSTSASPDFQSGNVSFTAGSDALTSFAFSQDLSGLGGGLTWNRVSATLIEGWDGPVDTGTKIVQLTLTPPASIGANSSGTAQVTATLLNNYDSHPEFTEDDTAQLGQIGVVASDQDGDSATATVNVAVSDDVPTLDVTGPTSVVEGASVNGTWSQVVGADQPGNVTQVVFNGTTYALGTPIDTGKGTLTVNANGTWTFAAVGNLDQNVAQSISFTVKVTDADDDVAQDVQTITIDDGAVPTGGSPLNLQMDDQNLTGGTTASNPDFVSANASFTAGSDALISFAFTQNISGLGGGLTWNRVSGTLIEGWDGPVGTGTKIVSLTLTPPASIAASASGTVTVTATLLDNYDSHPNVSLDDFVQLGNVGVVASDQDGDSATVTVNLSVSDDVPSAVNDGLLATVDDNAAAVNIGTVAGLLANDSYGADGQGTPAITIATGSLGGTITIGAGGTLLYTSNHNITSPYAPVDESFTYTIKDGDGDTATATFTVRLTDTGPSISLAAASITVDEDGLANGITTAQPGDVAGADVLVTGTLSGFSYGNDGPGSITLAAVANTGLVSLAGNAIRTVWDPVNHILTGEDSVTGADVFKLTITNVTTGAYQFELLAPVKHAAPAPNTSFENDATLTIGVTVTDAENESASGSITITIDDDSPTVSAMLNAAATAQLDETVAVAGGTPTLAVSNIGNDLDVSGGLLLSTATSGQSVVTVGGGYGADGQGSLTYSLVVGNAASGLKVTDGSAITLVLENGLIVGRVASGAFANQAAFAISIDASGVAKVEQYLSLQHPNTASLDEAVSMLAGHVGVNVTRVDADGDSITTASPIDISGLISFHDDGPVSALTVGEERGAELITVDNVAGDFATGQFSMKFGSDGASSSGFNITGPAITGVHYTETDVFDPQTGQFLRTELLAEVGTTHTAGTTDDLFKLTVNADGTYRFDLINAEQVTTEEISFASLSAGGPSFRELEDDPDTAVNETGRVEFESNGNGVNASTPGFGVSNQWTDPGEWFSMEFHNPGAVGNDNPWVNADLLDSLSLTVQQVQQGPVDFTWTANRYNADGSLAATESGNFQVTAAGVVTIDPSIEFSELRIDNVDANGGVRFATAVSVTRLVLPTDQNLNFQVNGTDGDGDPMTPITIGVLVDATSVPPVALDLDGDGLEFLSRSADVTHDYGSGLVSTAWVSSDDGLLAHAVGGFYDIVFADDAPGAKSDLEGLRLAYDSNGDRVFDADDAAFAEFGVWQDLNSNGVVDGGEFKSLADMGIASINLTPHGPGYEAADGDVTVLGETTFTRTDGTKGTVGDVMFATGSKDGDASKTVESTTSGFNQALIAASLVAVAGAAETVEQEPASVVAGNETTTDAAPEATTSSVSEPVANDDDISMSASSETQDGQVDDQPVEQTSHSDSDDTAPADSTLLGDDDASVHAANDDGQAQPALDDHQGLLAQTVDLPTFDANAAALAAVHEAASNAQAAQVVAEALGDAGAPDIDALLAALPGGEHAPVLLNPVAGDAGDAGHLMAMAASVFDAVMAAHEAMAVAHG